jgi:hypothetical protein
MGAYISSRSRLGMWIDAFWRNNEQVFDVTGKFFMLPHGSPARTHLLASLSKAPETASWVASPPVSH